MSHLGKVSRRDLLKGAAGAAAVLGGAGAVAVHAAAAAQGTAQSPGDADLALVNGRILTLDDRNTVASAVAIRAGRIAAVGSQIGRATRTIDLKGATVIPGLIDSHVHFHRGAEDPGYQMRILETATSVAEVLQMIRERTRSVPPGKFISCIGGWSRNGFAERRLPTLAELDAAAPRHPLFLADFLPFDGDSIDSVLNPGRGGEGAVTNSAGMPFFREHGVIVNAASGVLSPSKGQEALQSVQTDEDRRRSTADFVDFTASLGLTMITDFSDTAPERTFKYLLELWRKQQLNVRVRIRLGAPDVDALRVLIDHTVNRMGDDILRFNGIGEGLPGAMAPIDAAKFAQAAKLAAERGWSVSTHSIYLNDPMWGAELPDHIAGFQAANAEHPIRELRWSLAHANELTPALIQKLADMGVGVTAEGWGYGASAPGPAGPPYRTMVDKGIHVGGGTDATLVSQFNPWLTLYYMSTGRNSERQIVNAGQQVSRLEALKIYTRGSAWHSFDDDKLGSIETGKLADLAVLSDDPLTVSDDGFRKIGSTLTLQGGKIVYQT